MISRLWTYYMNSLSSRQAQKMQFRVRNSGRTSNGYPRLAPYNFAINSDWLDTHKHDPTHRAALADWGTYEDPLSFRSSSETTDASGSGSGSVPGSDDVEERVPQDDSGSEADNEDDE